MKITYTRRERSFAAPMKLANSGWGSNGRLFNSGWNCTPTNHGWSERSQISGSTPSGDMPANILPLVARHVYNQENTLQAALHCDRKLGFSTFMNDPQLGGVTLEDGQKLFDDMLLHQRDVLPKGWFE